MIPCLKTWKPKLLPLYCLLMGTRSATDLVRDTEVCRPWHEASRLGEWEGMWSWGWR